MQRILVNNTKELIEELKNLLETKAKEAIKERGRFRIGLSGGSLVKFTTQALALIDTDFHLWKFFFCDERFVEATDNESNFGQYKQSFKDNLKLEESKHFVWININLSLEECAKDYQEKIIKEFHATEGEIPQFDLLILGIGPDGHICSLFPQHQLLNEEKQLIAAIQDSPKPPSQRITMTLPLINQSRCCLFVLSGESKADIVKKVFVEKKESLPASLVKPASNQLICLMDKSAAKYLQ